MSDAIKLATIDELQPGQAKVCTINGREIALFNIDGVYCAIDNTCPHRGGPLGEGVVAGGEVTCPWHGWKFNVKTGACANIPTAKVCSHEVVVDGSDVKVKL
jgi:nitrite reductase/ring-hydroxylating ferredoxin subunit